MPCTHAQCGQVKHERRTRSGRENRRKTKCYILHCTRSKAHVDMSTFSPYDSCRLRQSIRLHFGLGKASGVKQAFMMPESSGASVAGLWFPKVPQARIWIIKSLRLWSSVVGWDANGAEGGVYWAEQSQNNHQIYLIAASVIRVSLVQKTFPFQFLFFLPFVRQPFRGHRKLILECLMSRNCSYFIFRPFALSVTVLGSKVDCQPEIG